MLIKSFVKSCPPRKVRPSELEVSFLSESVKVALDRNLTLKALFLLTMASDKRVGELHGLSAVMYAIQMVGAP